MDAAEKKRKMIIGAALVATLIAAALVEDDEEMILPVREAVTQSGKPSGDRTRNQAQQTEQLDTGRLGQRKFDPQAGALFMATTWAPKRPMIDVEEEMKITKPVKVFAPPPAPTAPPLQFKYTGKAIEDNQTWVFLSLASENFITKIGGKINAQYRLDAINDDAVIVTYLPLNVKQTLTINNKIAGNFR